MEAEQQNLALSCDDSYISLLISADPHDQQDLELNPTALMSDENFAQKLQLQEAIMSSLISNPIAPVVPHFTSNKMEIGASSYSHFTAIKTEFGESSTKQHLYMYCDICADRKNKNDFFPIQNCTHTFCNECISKHVSIKVEKGNIKNHGETFFPCPGIDCKGVLEMDTCRAILPKIVLSAWDEMICESMILESRKFYCPYKNCSGLLVNEGDEEGIIREAECPFCHRLFCANCRAPWHSGIECEEFLKLGENEREREDIMVHDLAKKNKWQRCSSCRFIVEKKEGCLHMTCVGELRNSRGGIVLAGLRLLSRLGGARRRKVKIKVMEWWRKMVFPVRRAWVAVSARVKARKKGVGLLKLHDDIQTCGYEDVQIMWEMLRRTELEVNSSSNHNKRKHRWFLRNLG